MIKLKKKRSHHHNRKTFPFGFTILINILIRKQNEFVNKCGVQRHRRGRVAVVLFTLSYNIETLATMPRRIRSHKSLINRLVGYFVREKQKPK